MQRGLLACDKCTIVNWNMCIWIIIGEVSYE